MKRLVTVVAASAFAVSALALVTLAPSGDAEPARAVLLPEQEIVSNAAQGLTSVQSATATAPNFTAVKNAIDASPVANVAIIIGDASGTRYVYNKGYFTVDRVTDIASASKWLTGTLLFRLIERYPERLSLETRPQQYLSYWTTSTSDPRSRITLEQLLSMRSGFNAGPAQGGCVTIPLLYTLQSCAQTIYQAGTDSEPGSGFSYGPHHIQVAAALGEAAAGGSFNSLFASNVTAPLGMSSTRFVKASNANPWAAGGAESTARDYAKLLHALLVGGFITDTAGFLGSRTNSATLLYAPASASNTTGHDRDWRYALGSFVECDGDDFTADGCAAQMVNSSPGAFGFTPWIDRANGYYAVIAMNRLLGDDDGVLLEQQVQPLIVAALQGQ